MLLRECRFERETRLGPDLVDHVMLGLCKILEGLRVEFLAERTGFELRVVIRKS